MQQPVHLALLVAQLSAWFWILAVGTRNLRSGGWHRSEARIDRAAYWLCVVGLGASALAILIAPFRNEGPSPFHLPFYAGMVLGFTGVLGYAGTFLRAQDPRPQRSDLSVPPSTVLANDTP